MPYLEQREKVAQQQEKREQYREELGRELEELAEELSHRLGGGPDGLRVGSFARELEGQYEKGPGILAACQTFDMTGTDGEDIAGSGGGDDWEAWHEGRGNFCGDAWEQYFADQVGHPHRRGVHALHRPGVHALHPLAGARPDPPTLAGARGRTPPRTHQ